jgi:hypothetical protein
MKLAKLLRLESRLARLGAPIQAKASLFVVRIVRNPAAEADFATAHREGAAHGGPVDLGEWRRIADESESAFVARVCEILDNVARQWPVTVLLKASADYEARDALPTLTTVGHEPAQSASGAPTSRPAHLHVVTDEPQPVPSKYASAGRRPTSGSDAFTRFLRATAPHIKD